MEALSISRDHEASAPICSICVANYNGVDIIDDCIRSILAQDADFGFEIIVHDDASTDGSVDHIRTRYPDVRVIASAKNVGFCVSNNRMAEQARGKYILLLNNDATLFPDALRTLRNHSAQCLEAAILGLPQYDAQTGKLIDIGTMCDPFLNPIRNINPARGGVAIVSGACMWIPRRLWDELGGFPVWFHTLAEDLYLCCVARLWGYEVTALPHSGFRHKVGYSLGGGKIEQTGKLRTSRRRRALSERNKTFVMALTYPAPMLLLLLPLHLAMLTIEGAIVSAIKRDARLWTDVYIACLKALVRERHRLHDERHRIQARRVVPIRKFFSAFFWFPHKLRMLLRHGLPEVR